MQKQMPISKYQPTPVPSRNIQPTANDLFVLLLGCTLDLRRSPECLLSVLALLAYFSHQ
jgi:hypothetical protein